MRPPSDLAKRPTLVIGADGLGPIQAGRLCGEGRLPHLQRLLSLGQRCRITPTVPEDPAVLWADLATGHNATNHGVLSVVKPTATGVLAVTVDDWRVPPLWHAAAERGCRTAVVNWPASTPGGEPSSAIWTVSDLQINASPGSELAETLLSADRRLSASDITPPMLETMLGTFKDTLRDWPQNDVRRLTLAAALARAGTIQNAAIDALDQPGHVPDLLMVRYDLVATLAELVMQRPGVFAREGMNLPTGLLTSIHESGAVLIDTMIGALLRRVPPDTAILFVGLLDDVDPSAAGASASGGPEQRSHSGDAADPPHTGEVLIRDHFQNIESCRKPGGFAVWHDPGSPLPAGQPAADMTLRELHGFLRTRLGIRATPWPRAISAVATMADTAAVQDRDDRIALGLVREYPDERLTRDALLARRALNLARSASSHRRWRFAVQAWDCVLERNDHFVCHAMRLESLLHAREFGRFDTELTRWLERVPNQPLLRQLVSARAQLAEPPPPPMPPADRVTPYIQFVDRARPEAHESGVWNELCGSALAGLEKQCRPTIASCRRAYHLFSRSWRRAESQGLLVAESPMDLSAQTPADADLLRQAMALTGPNSFGSRHGSVSERTYISPSSLTECSTLSSSPYSEAWLFSLHRGLYATNPDRARQAGRYRTIPFDNPAPLMTIDGRIVAGNTFGPPDQVPVLTNRMLAVLRRQVDASTTEPLITAALALVALLSIHPFADGNGRTARSLFQQVLSDTDYPDASRLDLPCWFERRRETYLAHVSMQPYCRVCMLSDPPPHLALTVNWLIELVGEAAEYANTALARVIGDR